MKGYRSLRLSRGQHNACKYKILRLLAVLLEKKGPRASLSAAELSILTGLGIESVWQGLTRWSRWQYLIRKGRRGRYRYRLGRKGERWVGIATAWLPRAEELDAEIIEHQAQQGLTDATEDEGGGDGGDGQ